MCGPSPWLCSVELFHESPPPDGHFGVALADLVDIDEAGVYLVSRSLKHLCFHVFCSFCVVAEHSKFLPSPCVMQVKSGRRFGRAFVGHPATIVEQYRKGRKWHVFLAVGITGVLAFWVSSRGATEEVCLCVCLAFVVMVMVDVRSLACAWLIAVNVVCFCQTFTEFLELFLFPRLTTPRVLLMDNLPVHHTAVRALPVFFSVPLLHVPVQFA